MNHSLEDTLWKMIGVLVLVVWGWLMVKLGKWLAGPPFRGVKITGKWIDGETDPAKSWGFNFTLFLHMEASDFDANVRKVIGVIHWEVTHFPDGQPKSPSHDFEIVSGQMRLSNGAIDNASLNLSHEGAIRRLIIPNKYDIKLTKRCCRRPRCNGTSSNPKDPKEIFGRIEGVVVADTR